jgi:hypothetical protein
MRAASAPGKSNECGPRWPLEDGREYGCHRHLRNRMQQGRGRQCMDGRQQEWRRSRAYAAACTHGALRMWREYLCASLAAMILVGLLDCVTGRFMVLRGSHDHRSMRRRANLANGHRSAALEGQHRDRQPHEETEEGTHDPSMVPQIKRMHQGRPRSRSRAGVRLRQGSRDAWDWSGCQHRQGYIVIQFVHFARL